MPDEASPKPIQPAALEPQAEFKAFAKSVEAINLVLGFLVAAGFDDELHLELPDPWPGLAVFSIGLLVVARYTIGASNHLFAEYVTNPRIPPKAWQDEKMFRGSFAFDAFFLLLFGFWARLSGSAKTWHQFFACLMLIFSQSLIWSWICKGRNKSNWNSGRPWGFWRILNLASLVLSAAAWFTVPSLQSFVSKDVQLFGYAALFMVLTFIDLRSQLTVMAGPTVADSARPKKARGHTDWWWYGPHEWLDHVGGVVGLLSFAAALLWLLSSLGALHFDRLHEDAPLLIQPSEGATGACGQNKG
jgi:hypothetical protein